MKKWLYPLLIAFVAFLIFSSPTSAGSQTRTFVIWLGDLAEAAGDFLDGLFTDEAEAETPAILQPGDDQANGGAVPSGPVEEVPELELTPTTEPVTDLDVDDDGTGDSSDGFDSSPTTGG